MSPGRRVVEEYTALLSRAFNGAIEVDGQRIVAHPSGILIARGQRGVGAHRRQLEHDVDVVRGP